jgi:hypothetical protein
LLSHKADLLVCIIERRDEFLISFEVSSVFPIEMAKEQEQGISHSGGFPLLASLRC